MAINDRLPAPGMGPHIDANRTVVRTNPALDAPGRIRHDMRPGQNLLLRKNLPTAHARVPVRSTKQLLVISKSSIDGQNARAKWNREPEITIT